MKTRFLGVVAIATLTAGAGQLAEARELIYGSWVSPKHPVMSIALPYLFRGVEKAAALPSIKPANSSTDPG